jgi:hypothetical protein
MDGHTQMAGIYTVRKGECRWSSKKCWYGIKSPATVQNQVILIAAGLTTMEERGVHTTGTCCSKYLNNIRMAELTL